jgi:superfamily II RNA helicase
MANEVHEMLDRARESMDRALRALDSATKRVIEKLEGNEEYDEKVGSHLAWVTAKVAEVTSALRQLEKHDKAMSRTPEQRFRLVIEYIKNELDPARRAQLAELLSGLEQERRVLS